MLNKNGIVRHRNRLEDGHDLHYLFDGRTPLLFVANDIIFVGKATAGRVRQRIEAATGVLAANILVAATHHPGPSTVTYISLADDPLEEAQRLGETRGRAVADTIDTIAFEPTLELGGRRTLVDLPRRAFPRVADAEHKLQPGGYSSKRPGIWSYASDSSGAFICIPWRQYGDFPFPDRRTARFRHRAARQHHRLHRLDTGA